MREDNLIVSFRLLYWLLWLQLCGIYVHIHIVSQEGLLCAWGIRSGVVGRVKRPEDPVWWIPAADVGRVGASESLSYNSGFLQPMTGALALGYVQAES